MILTYWQTVFLSVGFFVFKIVQQEGLVRLENLHTNTLEKRQQ